MTYQAEDKTRMKRARTEQAIQFAMQSRWDDAISVNEALIKVFPDDHEAYNRLGKALGETGRIKEARAAYQKSLELDPTNGIARKNLDRLASAKSKTEPDKAQQVDASLFIEEMGKTGVTTLKLANAKTLTTLSAGDEVALKPQGNRLTVETMSGEYMSDVEPKLALRLSKLIEGGNRYAAAVAGVEADSVRVIIKETFQHPTQAGRLSFPGGKTGELVRPYIREGILRGGDADEEEISEDTDDWDDTEEAEGETRETSLYDAATAEESDEEAEEFEE